MKKMKKMKKMKNYNYVSHYVVNRFLEPIMECASVSDDKDRYCTWSRLRDWKQLCMYVQRALSWHCRQQVWILSLLLSRGLHRFMQDSWAKRGSDAGKVQEARLLTDSYQTTHCVNLPSSRTNTAWSWKKKQTSVCSLCHHRAFMGWKLSPTLKSVSVYKCSRCILPLHCTLPLPLLCNRCHDPFIVRNAETCPPFIGFTQLAHPSRCSRETLTTVCFCIRSSSCALFSPGLCVHFGSLSVSGLQSLDQIHHRLRHHHLAVECGIHD